MPQNYTLNIGNLPLLPHYSFLVGKGGGLILTKVEKLSQGSKTLDMTSKGLGEMFKGDFADTCAQQLPLIDG